jgi:hypothetical protein
MFVVAQTRLGCDINVRLLLTFGRAAMAISTTALLGSEADAFQSLRPLFASRRQLPGSSRCSVVAT